MVALMFFYISGLTEKEVYGLCLLTMCCMCMMHYKDYDTYYRHMVVSMQTT